MSNAIWLENARKRRKTESEQKRTPSTSTDTGTGWLERARQRKYNEDVQNVDSSYINLFVDTANDFFSSAEEDYNNVGWGNAYKAYQNRESSKNDLEYRSNVIRDWLKNNHGSLDADTLQALTNSLDYFSTNAQSVVDSFSGARDFYSQFETEDAYNEYAAYDALLNFDLEAGEREIEELERRKEELESSGRQQPGSTYLTGDPAMTTSSYAAAHQDVDIDRALADLNALISEKTAYLNNARRAQDGAALAGAAQNADFDQFSGYAGDGTAPVMPSYNDIIYGWVNGKHHDLDLGVSTQSGSISYSDAHRLAATDYMTPEEVAIYNYHYNKDGLEAAERYLDSILEELNQRSGEKTYESELKDRTAVEMLYGTIAGFDQFATGLDSAWQAFLGDGGYIPMSAIQFASGMAREDLADVGFKLPDWLGGGTVGQATYDAITTTANMLPSILASIAIGTVSKTAGTAVGSALMGASAGGGAYQEKLNEGYSQEQARAYGIAVGVSEVVLEKLLGGISRLGGGMLPDSVLKNLAKADNVLARFSKTVGGQMLMSAGSEALEEGLQTVIEPYLWQIISGQEATVDWQEVFYSALLGAVTGGLFEGGEIAMKTAASNAQAKQIYGTDASALVAEALELNPDNAFAKRMQTRLDKGKELTGGQLNRLVQQNERVIAKQEQDIKTAESAEKQIDAQEYGRMVAAAEATQEGTEIKVGQDTTPQQNVAQGPEAEPVGVTVRDNRTVADNATGKETLQVAEESSVAAEPEEAGTLTLEEASKKYGAQAQAMIHTYQEGQNVAKYDAAYQAVYDMGRSGVALSYAEKSESARYLTEQQRELAYAAGKAAAETEASAKAARNQAAANGKTGRKKGGVLMGDGVTTADLPKNAYRVLSVIAKVTGLNVVLYKSETDADGNFIGAQGKYRQRNPGTVYIDIYAGLENIKDVGEMEKYVLLRTFAHEFTHFIENWNPIRYNELRRVVLDTLSARGMDVDSKIHAVMDSENLSYDAASREVVAQAMTDMLRDSSFVETLAQKHRTVFDKLREKLAEFSQRIKNYFENVGLNDAVEANALQEQGKYLDSIVKLWDEAAVQAVENYQQTVAVEQTSPKTEKTVPAVEKTEPVATKDAYGFTISDNAEYGSLEISFDSKPSSEVIHALKSNKFRWHKVKKVWFGYTDRQTITDALHTAYAAEKAEPVAEPEQSEFAKKFWAASQEERDEVVDAIQENTNITHMAPTEIRESVPVAENKEATENGKESENGSDTGAVPEPVRGSERPARLLEGVEPEAVSASSGGRGPVRTGVEHRTEDAERDGRTDAAGSDPVRSTGDRVGGHLQQLPGITEEAADTNAPANEAESLHEEVQREIEQKSTVNPKGSNFVIGDSLDLPSGTKARVRANIDAIRLVKQIAAENRIATAAEQEVLSKYVGWGGLADAFGKPVSNRQTRKIEYEAVKGLEKEFEELKAVLTEEEYKSARESTKNAHYTSIEVIKAMYDGLKGLGFTGGRMLEPSSGVGNFVGAMPADMTSTVKSWTMVELDGITGLFAKYLYPNADVRIQGFEQANIPDGYMDVAIGNVPFGNYGITDKHYPKTVTGSIHNYFFAKSLDKVRTGGIVMFITSHYTMDGRDTAVRKYMMQRADLLGAIRLPNTAFAGNAGTEVVTDILILKKRADRTEYAGQSFEDVTWHQGTTLNRYFAEHSEMVLGEIEMGRGMYGSYEMTVNPHKDKGSLGDQIREAFKTIQGKMDYPTQLSPEKGNFRQEAAKKKRQKLIVKDGEIYSRDESGNVEKANVDKDTAARISGMVAIRDAHTALCDALQQGVKKAEITKLRKALNKAYDSFVEKYGYLNSPKNKRAINTFTDRYAIQSLENYSTEGKKVTATKADIFTKDTVAANRTEQSAENVEEGLTISLNTVGTVDVGMIARLTGQKAESVQRQLIDQRLVFKDKDGNLIPAAQYLSGNVRAKLREMEGLVGIDPDYRNNVEALREVVPPTVQHTDIYVNPGANWVPASVYEDFVGYILKRHNHTAWNTGRKDFSVEYVPETNEYKVSINDAYAKMSAQNTQVWGEGGKAFSTIFENMLNGRRTSVYKDAGDGTRVLDKAKTEAVAEKAEKLNEEFRKWLWEDETRRAEMQELYNETYNALVAPKYSGKSLTVNGLNSEYTLRDHQKDAVARIINSGGNTLLAHRVGAGKTMEMAAAAMKLKQLGVIKKPMFVVPNNVVAQWGKEFMDYFPAANILLVGDEDMTPAERMTTINRIKNNDYDAVILAYTKFEKIQMTSNWRQKFYEEQIDSIMFAINAEKESQGGKGFTVKQLETKRKQLEAKLKKLTEKAKDEDGAMFEDLGVDSLFVDEAHNFKNLEYSTRMNNVSGLGKADGSQRAFDLYTKVRYLQQLNGGRGIVFATATPVMNSMTEMYIMQKYLQPDTLKQLGIEHFDSWAKMFGEVVNALEIAPSGSGYRLKQTFSKFKNVKALQQLFRSFTDVLTEVPGLKIPKMKGRKVQIVECEQGEFQKNYMEELAKRAENVKNVDPSEDNMLKITSDGRKISYSQRMIDPSLPYEETGKIYKCCENVWKVYQESSKTRGTQMIFCDMATPKGKSSAKADAEANADEFAAVDVESAQLYDDMKARLVQLGIPEKEIAFIHDAKNDKQKAALSEKMNNGTIRVLIGSTGKMGVGLNAQKKAVAIHHLDAPWRPGDIEQRDGRVFRQKNENEEAYKFVYVTRGSFDSRLWDILERKQKFINQVMNGEDVGNEIEDTGEVTLSAAEVKAVASDNPLIMEQVALEKEISKLQSLQQAYLANVSRAQEKMVTDRRNIANLENLIANGQTDVKNRKDTYSDGKFSMQLGGQTYTDKKDAAMALVAEAQAKAVEDGYTDIGSFAGFTLRVVKTREGVKGQLSGAGSYEFKLYPMNPPYGITHLTGVVESLGEKIAHWSKNLEEARSDLETQKQIAAAPFEQGRKLKEKRARYNEVMDILNPPKEEQSLDSDGGDAVQYQRRKHSGKDIRDDIYYPKNSRDAHAFIREYADKTSGMKDGETKNIFVTTENLAYFVTATGYLKGDIERVLPILGNENIINDLRKEFRNVTYTSAETSDQMAEDFEMQRGRDGWDHAAAGHTGVSGRNDAVDVKASGSDTFGFDWESLGYNSWEELSEAVEDGAVILDGNGNVITKQFQQRRNTLTNREVLDLAADDLMATDLPAGEREALNIFKGRLDKLKELQTERADLGRQYKDQQFGTKVDRAAAEKTRNRMQVLDGQIEKAKAEVLSIEDKKVLKDVLQKARKVVEKQQWTNDQEVLKRYRDRRNNAAQIKKYRDRLTKDVNDLTNWVLHPNNKTIVKHIPDVLKKAVIPFLSSIDFTSKRQLRGGEATKADQEFLKRLNGLKAALNPNTSAEGLYADYSDLPPNFMERLQKLIDGAQAIVDAKSGEFVVNQMTSQELRELSQVVRTLKTYIQQFNRFHANAMYQHVSEAGDNTIGELGAMENASDRTGTVSNFVFWQQIRPAYAFERFGEGGKAIYDGLRRGQAKLAFNTKIIQEFAEKAYTEKEVKDWEKEIKEIQLGDDLVRMPVSTIMSFYELSKRPQALGHILGQGFRVATYKANGRKISDVGHMVTPEDMQTIIGMLTDRQKEVADSLQKFMQEQGGKWGNYVSVKRFGEELFGEEHYFPINSDGRHLAANAEEHPSAASLYALLNMGFTKATTEGANNRLVVYSIFDVFANHMASMAQYNAFALPVVDAIKWFNYQQKSEPDENGMRIVVGSVRDQMDRVYGVPEETRPGSGRQGYAQSFVINILRAFNGTEAQGVPTDTTGMSALRQYNMAQVAFNLRVVVQQPLAITRAALLLDYWSISKGMKLSPAAIRQNIQEMQRYSGIAAWKSLGFYDVNISRGLTDIIKHSSKPLDKVNEVGMWAAEKADILTWAGIWSACKEEVKRKQKLNPKSEGFYDAVTQLFEDVVYKTQVVDSVLTKNEYMRSKGFFARATGSFMSEPTTTASMLIDAYDKYYSDLQRGMNRTQAWKKNGKQIVRTAYVYGISAVLLAAVQAAADAFRDDDDYQEWLEKWLEAFGGNLVDELMPLNKLPILSDFYEVAKELLSVFGVDTYGNAPTSVFMQWYDSLVKGTQILYDKLSGEDTNYTWYGGAYKLLQAVSGMTGLPMAAATREIVTVWNNIVGGMAPSLKVKTYEAGEKNEIKYAYQDGYLTASEAAAELLAKGLVENEDEAYWTIQGWEAGEGYSRYDALFDAVRNGDSIDDAMRELTSHGYERDEIISQVKSQVGEWYRNGEITKRQATDMLEKYTDLDSEEISKTVTRWSSTVVTGIAYEDIKDEYLAGNITAKRAIDMYVRYGGYSQERAREIVTQWGAEKDIGIAYDDIKEAFMNGDITEAEARSMYTTYGGHTEEEATEKVAVMAFVRKYPECDGISYAAIEDYQTYCEKAGVPAKAYYDVWKFNSGASADVDENGKTISGSKKAKVMAYIHGLNLTSAQKDSIYYAFGWAESTLDEAPWH